MKTDFGCNLNSQWESIMLTIKNEAKNRLGKSKVLMMLQILL